jgi:mevalonate kinase
MSEPAPDVAAVERTAPGKIILCGEHSVVYGHPAIAVPVSDLRARARVEPAPRGTGLRIEAPDLHQSLRISAESNPLARTAALVLAHLGLPEPDAVLTVESDLPIASGMGSGAAITVAAARALAAALSQELLTETVSEITYEVEKIHHGTPSGIDNTTIAWERPVYFARGEPPETFRIAIPFDILIANSGIASSTRGAIEQVRHQWHATPRYYEMVFKCIGAIARAARAAIEQGALQALGTLLNENHELLAKMGVSLPELDSLVRAARSAGALGAKLTGAGQGGNIIALVEEQAISAVWQALNEAGATQVWHTRVGTRSSRG